MLDEHRQTVGEVEQTHLLKPPFSFFDFVEDSFGNYDSIRRVFSLARSSKAKSLLLETIQPVGIIAEENADIANAYPDYANTDLIRISFWRKNLTTTETGDLTNKDIVGYAIFKHDTIPTRNFDKWHIFEAVFAKYPHDHNCVLQPQTYNLTIGEDSFQIDGVLYCQQNELNKACAKLHYEAFFPKYYLPKIFRIGK